MGIREDLQRKIERKRQEISEFEVKIKEANSYVQALEDMLKMLPREGVNAGAAAQYLRPNSGLAKAREAILKRGQPLHIIELLKALGRPVDRANKAGLSGSLAAYVRKGEIFTRPAPNTYGLIELGANGEQRVTNGPPPDFGKDDEE